MRSIFLLEDDPDDQRLFKEALLEVDPGIMLRTASNGVEGLEMLEKAILKPDIIFSDINMPLVNGIEFLTLVKAADHLNDIPVIVISTSKSKELQEEIYRLGGTFIQKPDEFKGLCNVIRYGLSLISH